MPTFNHVSMDGDEENDNGEGEMDEGGGEEGPVSTKIAEFSFSRALRMRRICSTNDDFRKQSSELKTHLL